MQWGLSLNIASDFDEDLWGLPPPSLKRWLTKSDGTKTLNILYHFQYAPQSWKEWQRVASIKIQIQMLIHNVSFDEYSVIEQIDKVYTISKLGEWFPGFVRYQKPLYPSDKSEFMRSLTMYAKRLYYEKQWHYEAVMAMALHFNSKCKLGYSFRDLNRKVKSVIKLDRTDWKIKLSDQARHQVLSNAAYKSAQVKRDKAKPIRDEAILLKANGNTLKDIAYTLDISLSSVRRYVA